MRQCCNRDQRPTARGRIFEGPTVERALRRACLCGRGTDRGLHRHAGYIASWISLLKVDARAFFTASKRTRLWSVAKPECWKLVTVRPRLMGIFPGVER